MLQNAYLLRFWRSSARNDWRITLIPVGEDSTEQHFGTLDDLYRHLQESYTNPIEAGADPRRHTKSHEGRGRV
ncbi:MAG: hypothetical protein R2856_40170, partial [Caldilineaceae bacterium]|nr:hypothetical protein [Caldilineaceae bacterium]